ncbi:FecCD family ABC transporter permease [Phytohabitans houttuyneae]|uniref:ABC transporter permease n=1 Tax=Phytohabitans houttuyneae TaxID=1076126 RepID=A0A6V8KF96_9ACTN|nr:iron chelate uptake ABC transporter family permease subunit [Phytohabitans houttuyneae]GFJ80729.1 ABC transporter permease [Phytohabitans houttuyneae]
MKRSFAVGLALLATCVTVAVVALGTGDYPISPTGVVRSLVGQGNPATEYIVLDLRLPRVLTALAVGAAFGASGAIFQSLTRNPLGSPDVIGFTAGASVGALIMIILVGGGLLEIASGAVLGGAAAAAAVYLLAYRRGSQGYRLVIIGVAVQALLTAVTTYLLARANIFDSQRAALWIMGSLNARGWAHAAVASATLAALLPVVLALHRRTLVLEMGDETARSLGVSVERVRLALIATAVALAAVGTTCAGPIAFVALAAPQLARRLTRATGPNPLPSAAMGAALLLASDLVAQRALAPTQLPVGVVTAALGGLYLIWLLGWRRTAA